MNTLSTQTYAYPYGSLTVHSPDLFLNCLLKGEANVPLYPDQKSCRHLSALAPSGQKTAGKWKRPPPLSTQGALSACSLLAPGLTSQWEDSSLQGKLCPTHSVSSLLSCLFAPKWSQGIIFHKPLITLSIGITTKPTRPNTHLCKDKHINMGPRPFPAPTCSEPYLLHPPCRALTSGWDPDNMLGAWDTPTTSSSSHLLSPEYFECTLLCFQKFSNLNNKLYGLPNLRGIKHFTETKLVNKGPDHYFPGPLYKHLTWISASTLSCCSLTNITKHLLYIWIILETVYIRIKQTRLLLSSSLYSIFRNILKTKTWPWHFPALNLL